jgi:hypothetical protein
MTNNSPYFLGFLFFLVSLLMTFRGYSMQSASLQVDYIIHQLGSALSSTIVGLTFRQLLFAYSPAQADQDFFFRTLEEELRRSATEFKRSQAELVQLVQEFVQVRKTLFSEEEKAARKYVGNLERAIALFDENLSNYPAVISSALSNCTQSLHVLKEKLRELTQAAERTDPRQLSDMVAQFDNVKTYAGGLAAELSGLKGAVEQMRVLAKDIPVSVKEELLSAKTDLDGVRAELKTKIIGIQSDITAIDKVLSDFVTVMQERIEAMR